MTKQLAKAKHYGQVQGWIQAPKRPTMVMNRAQRQAMNKLTYNEYHGRMDTWVNATRHNLYIFKDGRRFEATPLNDGTGNWLFEKCGA